MVTGIITLSADYFTTCDHRGNVEIWHYDSDKYVFSMKNSLQINFMIRLPNDIYAVGESNGGVAIFSRILNKHEVASTPEITFTPFYTTSNSCLITFLKDLFD